MTKSNQDSRNYKIEDYAITEKPFYIPTSDEINVFESAYNQKVPVLLKGPQVPEKQDLLNICHGK